mmetsp:Transcript_11812/g.37772  ORF Transcript_11812/g.37772 Transcript_11812/m.37772 type:complete len:216 (-) Transcript_11812:336-983(-)
MDRSKSCVLTSARPILSARAASPPGAAALAPMLALSRSSDWAVSKASMAFSGSWMRMYASPSNTCSRGPGLTSTSALKHATNLRLSRRWSRYTSALTTCACAKAGLSRLTLPSIASAICTSPRRRASLELATSTRTSSTVPANRLSASCTVLVASGMRFDLVYRSASSRKTEARSLSATALAGSGTALRTPGSSSAASSVAIALSDSPVAALARA